MGQNSDVKCCVDDSYDPDFRYASNEPTPSDWAVGLGVEDGNGDVDVGQGESNDTPPPTPLTPPAQTTTTTTGNSPIKKSSSSSSSSIGPFDDNGAGYARSSNPGVMNSNNGQCECKSLEKSIGWIK